MKPEWRTGLSPEYTTLTFGLDPDKGTDPGMFLSLPFTLQNIGFFIFILLTVSLISQGIKHGITSGWSL